MLIMLFPYRAVGWLPQPTSREEEVGAPYLPSPSGSPTFKSVDPAGLRVVRV